MRGRKWTKEEDSILRELVGAHGKQWSLIASKMENRTASQVSSRWEKCIDPSLTKGPFSPEEDRKVIDYVNKNGPTNWPRLAEILKVRSPKQCRERWFNHLDPNLSKESWTMEEDLIVLEQHTKIGPKWSAISRYLPHRSDNSIKNRWNSSISKRIKYDANGTPILIDESQKRNAKQEKQKSRPLLHPLPITNAPPEKPPSTDSKGKKKLHLPLPTPQNASQMFMQMRPVYDFTCVPQDSGIPLHYQQQVQRFQQLRQMRLHSLQMTAQNQSNPQITQITPSMPQVQQIQQPQAIQQPQSVDPQQAEVAPQSPMAAAQNTPLSTETQLFQFTSTPLAIDFLSPTSPSAFFAPSPGGLSPFKRGGDRNVFK